MDSGSETKITIHENFVVKYLINAVESSTAIEILYRKASSSTYKRRLVHPKKVFSSSRYPGVLYMRAISSAEEKLFRVDKVAIWSPKQGDPHFAELPMCIKPECDNHVHYKIPTSIRLTLFDHCQECLEASGHGEDSNQRSNA